MGREDWGRELKNILRKEGEDTERKNVQVKGGWNKRNLKKTDLDFEQVISRLCTSVSQSP